MKRKKLLSILFHVGSLLLVLGVGCGSYVYICDFGNETLRMLSVGLMLVGAIIAIPVHYCIMEDWRRAFRQLLDRV